MARVLRRCPECGNNSVDTEKLFEGTPCLSCGKLIEAHFLYAAGVPAILGALALIAFTYSFGALGVMFTVLVLLFSFNRETLLKHHFPLRCYENE
ncbi:hypothetical protein OE749_08055 [Aestuariibacter sp. AA17]|uniref:DUF983 domain-containing protein n=1 Tax=Fluctibacter corallii TaxID=2984329 RepID=A0ABT3A7H9_9ALTE|nr:hypothetical protein [Aestuariibacter sp. AA17]MCV2884646.1 hypothetical protein [Aestuariibacter sp. AA17]